MHITKKIKTIKKNQPILFTTSGSLVDFSEFQGLDNLQNPTGPILKSLQKTAKIYDTKSTFYLINGSSSGIIAIMLATVKREEKVLIARNAHKSVINALILSGADPVWAETEWNREWNIPSGVNPETIAQKLDANPEIKSVWITSPTYEGIASDIRAISRLCRQRNALLIVDEAHGALWPFSELLPPSSIYCGADACVQSLHKNCACINPGAILHLSKESRINPEKIQQALNIINTTSPSYILLSGIERTINHLNSKKGKQKLNRLLNNINNLKNRLQEITDAVFLENSDPTKIFFGIKGLSGYEISELLERKFNIEVELNNNIGLLALTGIETSEKTLETLENSIIKIDKNLKKTYKIIDVFPYIPPKTAISPSKVFLYESKTLEIKKTVGLISRETIVNYPPGIPLIIAGEIVQEKHLELLRNRKTLEIINQTTL